MVGDSEMVVVVIFILHDKEYNSIRDEKTPTYNLSNNYLETSIPFSYI